MTLKKSSANEKLPWIKMMVKMQARACVISRLTGMPAAESRRIWHAENSRSSPSGQQPNDLQWFLKTAIRRSHSALILTLNAEAQRTMPAYAAFAHAYYHYARITSGTSNKENWVGEDPAYRKSESDYVIPFSRAHYLSEVYTDDTRLNGERKCPLMLRRCKACEGVYLSHESETEKNCPNCVSVKKGGGDRS